MSGRPSMLSSAFFLFFGSFSFVFPSAVRAAFRMFPVAAAAFPVPPVFPAAPLTLVFPVFFLAPLRDFPDFPLTTASLRTFERRLVMPARVMHVARLSLAHVACATWRVAVF